MIKSSEMTVKLAPHNLRDIYASTALLKGYDVVAISKHPGHIFIYISHLETVVIST